MKLQKFSGGEADWDEWHKVCSSQARVLGFAEELVETDEIRVGAQQSGCRPAVSESRVQGVAFPHHHLQRHGAGDRAEHQLAPAWLDLLQRYRARGL